MHEIKEFNLPIFYSPTSMLVHFYSLYYRKHLVGYENFPYVFCYPRLKDSHCLDITTIFMLFNIGILDDSIFYCHYHCSLILIIIFSIIVVFFVIYIFFFPLWTCQRMHLHLMACAHMHMQTV